MNPSPLYPKSPYSKKSNHGSNYNEASEPPKDGESPNPDYTANEGTIEEESAGRSGSSSQSMISLIPTSRKPKVSIIEPDANEASDSKIYNLKFPERINRMEIAKNYAGTNRPIEGDLPELNDTPYEQSSRGSRIQPGSEGRKSKFKKKHHSKSKSSNFGSVCLEMSSMHKEIVQNISNVDAVGDPIIIQLKSALQQYPEILSSQLEQNCTFKQRIRELLDNMLEDKAKTILTSINEVKVEALEASDQSQQAIENFEATSKLLSERADLCEDQITNLFDKVALLRGQTKTFGVELYQIKKKLDSQIPLQKPQREEVRSVGARNNTSEVKTIKYATTGGFRLTKRVIRDKQLERTLIVSPMKKNTILVDLKTPPEV